MKIRLEYVAMLQVKGARSGEDLVVEDGATIGSLLELLHIRPEHRRVIAPFVNDRRGTLTTGLREGDRVFLALPVGGG
mgnify:CR=1 FL=1